MSRAHTTAGLVDGRAPSRPGPLLVSVMSFALVVLVAAAPAEAQRLAPDAAAWTRPVGGRLVEGFDAPTNPFGAGHRGADFAAGPGEPVRAAGSGTVSFAGAVAGSIHVTVDHGDGVLTTYSFLERANVSIGTQVERGAAIGRAGGTGGHHPAGVMHMGLRVGGVYVDPMSLFQPVDLTERVHLVAVSADNLRPAPDPHGVLVDLNYDIERGGLPEWLYAREWVDSERNRRRSALDRAVRSAVGFGRALAGASWDALDDIAHNPYVPVVGLAIPMDVAEAVYDHVTADCTPAQDVRGGLISYRDVMFVAGIDSSMRDGRTNEFPLEQLYPQDRIHWYSYRDDGSAYDASDTHQSIDQSAQLLAEQLRATKAAAGRPMETDLVAHSQGGVVVQHFLSHYWDPTDPTLPLISRVVLISSPLEGAPGAIVLDEMGDTLVGSLAAGVLPLPNPRAPALSDLRSDSARASAAREWVVPESIEVVSIGIASDAVVPSTTNDDVRGVASVPTRVSGTPLSVHRSATTDGEVVKRAAVTLGPGGAACARLSERLEAAVFGNAISSLEHGLGLAAGGYSAPFGVASLGDQ